MQREPLAERARGRWRSILPMLGVAVEHLSGKHGPCPMCGGTDRFRFDDREGRGSYICSQCGAGDGVGLLMAVHGWDFRTAAREIERIVDDAVVSMPRQREISPERRREMLRSVWTTARRIERGDCADKYLRARGIERDDWPSVLRVHDSLPYRHDGGQQTHHPAIVALVNGPDGSPASIHRTWLALDGSDKARVPKPRKMMPGELPPGHAIRLDDATDTLVVAEGIETALSAAALWRQPCWALVNANNLAKWRPPAGVKRVLIAGDADTKFAGQTAAYMLANALACSRQWVDAGVTAEVLLPERLGCDWNDVLRDDARTAA